MKIRVIAVLLLGLLALTCFLIWWRQATQPVVSGDKQAKIFVVPNGESIRLVARRLEDDGLIRSKLAFFLLVKQKGAEKNIQAGTFRLSPSMKPEAILEELSHGTLDIWVTVIEGWRNEEVVDVLSKELNFSPQAFLDVAAIGYMFPDTYAFPKESPASTVAKIMQDNFNRKFDQKLEEEVRKEGLSEKEAVTLASIIEREARRDEDRPLVAGVLLNRLRQNMVLQTDATVQYALGYQADQKSWWKKTLTRDDLKIKSPYNTYLHAGLPPTPICNPGLASIKAIAEPEKTDYLYYLSDKSGKMHYAKTLEEHNENTRKYLSD